MSARKLLKLWPFPGIQMWMLFYKPHFVSTFPFQNLRVSIFPKPKREPFRDLHLLGLAVYDLGEDVAAFANAQAGDAAQAMAVSLLPTQPVCYGIVIPKDKPHDQENR